jgi:molybdopterin-guanine dinucleotide biosynthesis protein A
MGRPKLMLPFGPEVMLVRVARLLREAVEPVIVVAGVGQDLLELPPEIVVVHDRCAGRGPLEGLAVGLRELGERAEAAFVTGCDVPLLRPQFVKRMIELSAGYDVAVPSVDGFDHPLAAVYRSDVLPQVEALLAKDRLRPAFLFEEVSTRKVTAQELLDVDRRLRSLANVNSPAAYRAALIEAGFEGQASV